MCASSMPASREPGRGDDGTQLYTALDRALADVPRQRLAGVVMITDGEVHDMPPAAAASLAARRAAARAARPGTRARPTAASSSTQAPSFGLVGKEVPLTLRVEDLPEPQASAGGRAQARLTWRKDGGAPHPRWCRSAATCSWRSRSTMAGRTCSNSRSSRGRTS